MKKDLLINESPNKFGCTYIALREFANVLEHNEIVAEILYLGKKPIAGCIYHRRYRRVNNKAKNSRQG